MCDFSCPLLLDQGTKETIQGDEVFPHLWRKTDSRVEGTARSTLVLRNCSPLYIRAPVNVIKEGVYGITHYLEAGKGHLDEDPFHLVEESLEGPAGGLPGLAKRGGGIGRMPFSKSTDRRDDAGLAVRVPAVLFENAAALVGEAVGQVR